MTTRASISSCRKDIKDINTIEVNNKITIGTGDNQTVIEGDTINTGSVTTGNTTINNDGLTIVNEDSSKNITINNNNVNMGGNKIESVAPGKVSKESTDAVNGSQLFATNQTVANLGGAVNKLVPASTASVPVPLPWQLSIRWTSIRTQVGFRSRLWQL